MASLNKLRKWSCFKCTDTVRSDEHCQVSCGCGLTIHRKCMADWQLRELPESVGCPVCGSLWGNPVLSRYQKSEEFLERRRSARLWPLEATLSRYQKSQELLERYRSARPWLREAKKQESRNDATEDFVDDHKNKASASKCEGNKIIPEHFAAVSEARHRALWIYESAAAAEHFLAVIEAFEMIQAEPDKTDDTISKFYLGVRLFRMWNSNAEWIWPALRALAFAVIATKSAWNSLQYAETRIKSHKEFTEDYLTEEASRAREEIERSRARHPAYKIHNGWPTPSLGECFEKGLRGTKRLREVEAEISASHQKLALLELKREEASRVFVAQVSATKELIPDFKRALAEIITILSSLLE